MRRFAFIAVLCTFVSAPAGAGIYVKEIGVTPGLTMGVVASNGYSSSVWVGVYNLSILGSGAADLGIEGTVQSFCIDVWDYAPSGGYVSYRTASLEQAPDPGAGPMGVDRARYLATLLNMHWEDALTDNLHAAALQTAVWEIVDEGLGNDPVPAEWNAWKYTNSGSLPSSGNFYVTNYQVAMLANAWLGEVRNIGGSDYENRYLALSNHSNCGPYYQDYVVRVPLPAASLLGVIGMAMAGIKLRRRAEKQALVGK